MIKSKYILFKNAISLLVAFATNLPELIAPNNVKWTYVETKYCSLTYQY